jgi:ADP-ribose pyrophosphatase YjhB (NUDIX family)
VTPAAAPAQPSLWVGAVVVDDDRLLLVWCTSGPARERWSVPAVAVALDEPLAAAVVRAVDEQAGLEAVCEGHLGHVELLGGEHRVVLAFRATLLNEAVLKAAATWVGLDDVAERPLVDGLGELLADQGILRVIA